MKNHNKKNKLILNKTNVTELSSNNLKDINGGTFWPSTMLTSFVIYTGGEDGQFIKVTQ